MVLPSPTHDDFFVGEDLFFRSVSGGEILYAPSSMTQWFLPFLGKCGMDLISWFKASGHHVPRSDKARVFLRARAKEAYENLGRIQGIFVTGDVKFGSPNGNGRLYVNEANFTVTLHHPDNPSNKILTVSVNIQETLEVTLDPDSRWSLIDPSKTLPR